MKRNLDPRNVIELAVWGFYQDYSAGRRQLLCPGYNANLKALELLDRYPGFRHIEILIPPNYVLDCFRIIPSIVHFPQIMDLPSNIVKNLL